MAPPDWTTGELCWLADAIDQRASWDRSFRKRALTEPRRLIQEMTGRSVPGGDTALVLEHSPGYGDLFPWQAPRPDEEFESLANAVATELFPGTAPAPQSAPLLELPRITDGAIALSWSRYNLLHGPVEGEFLLYNSLSNTLAVVDARTAGLLAAVRDGGGPIDWGLHPGLFLQLRCSRVLVTAGEEERLLQVVRLRRRFHKLGDRSVELTVAPTLDCNLACPYCYQAKTRRPVRMDERTEQAVVRFLGRLGRIPMLKVVWFGGEPLMEFPTICRLTERIETSGIRLQGHVVTNGYLLDRDVAQRFRQLHIRSIQLTLDGPPLVHDRRRPRADGVGTYDRILANLEYLLAVWDGKCSVRVNVEKDGLESFAEVHRTLTRRFGGARMEVYPGFVTCDVVTEASRCWQRDRRDEADFLLRLQRDHGIVAGAFFPQTDHRGCMATRRNAFAIGPEGEVYNCWNDLGRSDRVLGNVDPDRGGLWNSALLADYMLGADVFDEARCRGCWLLPVCDGGCVEQRLRWLREGLPIDVCLRYKRRMAEFLEVHRVLQRRGAHGDGPTTRRD